MPIENNEFSLLRYDELAADTGADIFTIGRSVKNRPINVLKKGDGKIKILFVARIHGNEPATTEALLEFIKEYHSGNFSVYGIFLANPDGAALYEKLWRSDPGPHWENAFGKARLNANGVDINRDWFDLSQPETKAIHQFILDVNPDFAVDFHEYYWAEKGYPPKYPADDENGFMATMTDAPFFGAHEYVKKLSENAMNYLTEKLEPEFGWKIKHRHFTGTSLTHLENPAFLGIYLALRGIPKLLIETWGVGCSTLLLHNRIKFHKSAMKYLFNFFEVTTRDILNKPVTEELLTFDISQKDYNITSKCSEKLTAHRINHNIEDNKLLIRCSPLESGFVKTIFNLMFEKENIEK